MAIKPYAVQDFLAELDRYDRRVPLDELTRRLEQLDIDFDDVRCHANFGSDHYQRNLLHNGKAYSALVLCWRAGQRSPIHDHRGSSCGVKVIKGVATETFFDRTPHGHVYATGSRALNQGAVCGSQDDDLHQMSNLQAPGQDLITLHIYSPPLIVMGLYSLTETRVREFNDPVATLCDGAGI
jgi:cysteine dioxygenase